MQLTSFTDYGLRALIYMATLPEGRLTNITEVTDTYGVSRNHMVKIINQLSRAGFVSAIRGKNGGIRLGMSARDIVIGEVVRKMEPLQLVDCSNCSIAPACRLKKALHDAVQLFLQEITTPATTNPPPNRCNRRSGNCVMLKITRRHRRGINIGPRPSSTRTNASAIQIFTFILHPKKRPTTLSAC